MEDDLRLPVAPESAADASNEPRTWQRKHERHKANWPARCTYRGLSWPVVVADVSAGGAGLDRDLPIAQNETAVLEMQDVGSYECRVAWKSGSRCGLEFLRQAGEPTEEAVSDLADSLSGLL